MSVSVFFVRAFVEAVERAGGSRADVYARIPLDARRLENPDARLEIDEFGQILKAAIALTGDSALGLHVGEQISERTLDLAAKVVGHAPTIRDALATATQFASFEIDGLRLLMRDEQDLFVVRCVVPRSTAACDRALIEFVMAGLVRLARTFIGPQVVPRLVCFEYGRATDRTEYVRIFGSKLRFGQSASTIAFDLELADRPQIHQHRDLYLLLRAEAQRRLEQTTASSRPSVRLRKYLLAIRPSQIPDMAKAARDLGMSERSLRRHLAAEGTSYRDLVRSALEMSAGRMLRDSSRPLKEVASALGFADAAAFHHAFKRWTGRAPGEYRRRGRSR